MNGEERLEQWWASGTLVRPLQGPGLRDLIAALIHLAGGPRRRWNGHAEWLEQRIGQADHYLVVLLDGVGSDIIRMLPRASFLRSHTDEHLRTVFPSTTAAALTTAGTALWPASHGIVGWWLYLMRFDVSIVTLPFRQRITDRPLQELGIDPSDVYLSPSVWPQLRWIPRSVMPREIADSDYTRYTTGGTRRLGYESIIEAVERAYTSVARSDGPSFTYLYIPDIDSAMHKRGTRGEGVREELLALDTLLGQLACAVAGRARFVASADHGQVDIPQENLSVLGADDPLATMLRAQPSGEGRVPFFHVRPGMEQVFARQFVERFGDQFVLISPDEAERLGLFGPEPLAPVTRERIGTAIGISSEPRRILIEPCGKCGEQIGSHGGLLPEEMLVPLVIA